MKIIAHIPGLILICAASVSTVWISSSISSTANAKEPICNPMKGSSGIELQRDAIAPCNSINQQANNSKESLGQSKSEAAVSGAVVEKTTRIQPTDAKVDSFYPAYCPTLSSKLSPEDYLFRQTLERCKYGH